MTPQGWTLVSKPGAAPLSRLLASYGAHNIRLFGSFARGDHADASNVDVLADVDDGVGLCQVARLVAALEALLDSHVEVVNTGALRPWDDDVLEEAIPL